MPLTASTKGGRQLVITVKLCQTSVSMTALMLALPAQGRTGTGLQRCMCHIVLVGCDSVTVSVTARMLAPPASEVAASCREDRVQKAQDGVAQGV